MTVSKNYAHTKKCDKKQIESFVSKESNLIRGGGRSGLFSWHPVPCFLRALSEYCFACGSLGRALIYEGNETVLGTNPNRTHDQPKPYLETEETVLDLYSDKSQSPDLPLPHGLAPSETMVSDHGLGPPLSTENPRNKGFSGPGAPIFGFGLGDPATKG